MKHNWEKDENGNVNKWAWEVGFHNGVFCVDCGKSVCVHCDPNYMDLDDCTGPKIPKALTNADHIRTMSDEELAEFLERVHVDPCSACCDNLYWCRRNNAPEPFCQKHLFIWLQQPAEEDT